MNEMIKKFLLVDISLYLRCLLDSQDLHIVLVDPLVRSKKEYKNLKKQEIQDILIQTN